MTAKLASLLYILENCRVIIVITDNGNRGSVISGKSPQNSENLLMQYTVIYCSLEYYGAFFCDNLHLIALSCRTFQRCLLIVKLI